MKDWLQTMQMQSELNPLKYRRELPLVNATIRKTFNQNQVSVNAKADALLRTPVFCASGPDFLFWRKDDTFPWFSIN